MTFCRRAGDCILLLVAAGVYPVGAAGSLTLSRQPPYRYDFQLEKGKGVGVCDAYVKRLRNTDFPRLPQCDRPENSSVPGFRTVNRAPLTKAETLGLYESIEGSLFLQDPGFVKRRADAASRGVAYNDTSAEIAAARQDEAPAYFRFEPRIDLDNDGVLDNIVMWKQSGMQCGALYPPQPFPVVAGTYLVALDQNGVFSMERTRAILEWPNPPGLPIAPTPDVIHVMAHTFGVFNFEGEYYFDAFFPSESHRNADLEKGKMLSDLLGVFQRHGTSAAALCEIRWYDRPQ